VTEAGTRRFRVILLTSLTTFFGLAPMLLEQSVQAQEIVPMAISLAFGIVFATVITLLLVPSLYLILMDLQQWKEKRQARLQEAWAAPRLRAPSTRCTACTGAAGRPDRPAVQPPDAGAAASPAIPQRRTAAAPATRPGPAGPA